VQYKGKQRQSAIERSLGHLVVDLGLRIPNAGHL
jgi:hypothetical protein